MFVYCFFVYIGERWLFYYIMSNIGSWDGVGRVNYNKGGSCIGEGWMVYGEAVFFLVW